MFKLILGNEDITNLVSTVTLSGGYNQCRRSLSFGLIYSDADRNIPYIETKLADRIKLYDNKNNNKFTGKIVKRKYDSSLGVLNLACFDDGLYLKKNTGFYSFSNAKPEDIARTVCNDFNIKIGKIARTGVRVSRTFLGNNLYDIIMRSYTKASEVTGKKYFLRFDNGELCIYEKFKNPEAFWIRGYSNLISLIAEESYENMVNRVAIYDSNNNFVRYIEDKSAIRGFGTMTACLKQIKEDNRILAAQKKIKDGAVSKKITVNNIGDWSLITGESVYVYDAYSNINGTFIIDADTHKFSKGQYTNSLTLNFENIMDEKTLGG